MLFRRFSYCILFTDAVGRSTDKQTPQPLLLFLIDGFRWDYLDRYERGELPGFQRLVEGGTRAEYLVPDYLSDSYPNYYSLMTVSLTIRILWN